MSRLKKTILIELKVLCLAGVSVKLKDLAYMDIEV